MRKRGRKRRRKRRRKSRRRKRLVALEHEAGAGPEVVEGEGDEPAPDGGQPLLDVSAEGFSQGPRLRLGLNIVHWWSEKYCPNSTNVFNKQIHNCIAKLFGCTATALLTFEV